MSKNEAYETRIKIKINLYGQQPKKSKYLLCNCGTMELITVENSWVFFML